MFKSTTLLYASLAMFIMSLLSCAAVLFLPASVNFCLGFIAYVIAGLCFLAMGFIAND
tara:strand:- start:534 stop:707 length:174 start_codon:yes stop_codon:yes gene_type:complete